MLQGQGLGSTLREHAGAGRGIWEGRGVEKRLLKLAAA